MLIDAASSDFDQLSNTWCTGSDTWVRTALPGLVVASGQEPNDLDMPGIRYHLSIWLDQQFCEARVASSSQSDPVGCMLAPFGPLATIAFGILVSVAARWVIPWLRISHSMHSKATHCGGLRRSVIKVNSSTVGGGGF